MIYCVVMYLVDGLVFVFDLWINVGIDYIVIFCKLFIFGMFGECLLVVQMVGNLVIL